MGYWEMTNVPLSIFKYDKQRRTLSIAYKDLPVQFSGRRPPSRGDGFPLYVNIHSEKTGRTVQFFPVGRNDSLYSEDQWDGEQQIYRPYVVDGPRVVLETVDHQVIHYE